MSAAPAEGELAAPRVGTLRLGSILTSGLPAMLGTDDAPKTYTVPAIFTRQVSPSEKSAIQSADSTRRLADRGYPRVTLKVSDRRLLIENTCLDQLRSGLAHEVATLLSDIEDVLNQQRDLRAAAAVVRLSAETDRAASIQHLVEGIRFV